jgi:hypothetical protein
MLQTWSMRSYISRSCCSIMCWSSCWCIEFCFRACCIWLSSSLIFRGKFEFLLSQQRRLSHQFCVSFARIILISLKLGTVPYKQVMGRFYNTENAFHRLWVFFRLLSQQPTQIIANNFNISFNLQYTKLNNTCYSKNTPPSSSPR